MSNTNFFSLPRHLSVAVLRDWLDGIKDITAMDVAVGSQLRPKFIDIVSDFAFILSDLDIHLFKSISSCVHWLNAHRLRVQALTIDTSHMADLCKLRVENLQDLRSLRFHGLGTTLKFDELHVFLTQCRQLHDVDLHRCQLLPVDSLETLSSIPQIRPERLNLSGFQHMPVDTIIKFILHFSRVIEKLKLSASHSIPEVLHAVQSSCHRLKKLSICPQGISNNELVTILSSFVTLEQLSLHDAAADNDLAMNLAQHVPNLIVLKFKDVCKVTSSSLPELLKTLPRFEVIEVNAVYLYRLHHHLRTSSEQSLLYCANHAQCSCELNFTRSVTDPGVLIDSITACPVPVSHFYCASPLRSHTLQKIVELTGGHLHSLKVCLHHDVDDRMINCIAEHSRHLHTLELSKCHNLTDDTVASLAAHCRHLKTVALKDAQNISDASVIILLGRLQGSLRNLYLTGCKDISDTSMEAFMEFGRHLQIVSLYGTGVTVDGIVSLVTMKAMPSLRYLTLADNLKTSTLERFHDMDPTLTKRWRKILTSFIF